MKYVTRRISHVHERTDGHRVDTDDHVDGLARGPAVSQRAGAEQNTNYVFEV